jgi:hypothetical protein
MAMSAGTDAPAQGEQLVARAIGALFGRRLGLDTETRPEALRLTEAHRCFLCDLEQAAQENVLAGAIMTGWRYVVLYDDQRDVLRQPEEREVQVEVEIGQVNGDWQVVSAAESPFLEGELQELAELETRSEVTSGSFEICYLVVAGSIARAWWLRAGGGDSSGDLLLPVQRSNRRLRENGPRLFGAADFRAEVATIARQKREQSKSLLRVTTLAPAAMAAAAGGEAAAVEGGAAGGAPATGATTEGG